MSEYKFQEIEVFHTTNAALAQMQLDYANPPVPQNTKDPLYKALKEGCTFLQKTRKAVDVARKEKTEEWRKKTDEVNQEAKRITKVITDLEEPWKEAKKKIDEEAERQKQERIAKLQIKVDELGNWIEEARGKSSEEIANIIEAVDMIDTEDGFFDLTKEAGIKKAEVLERLSEMMLDAKNKEDREKAEAEARELRQKAEVDQKINEFKMIAADMFGKSSSEIEAKYNELGEIHIDESVFGDRTHEAQVAINEAMKKLGAMAEQQKLLEKMEADKAEEEAEPEQSAEEVDPEEPGISEDPEEEKVFADEIKARDDQVLNDIWRHFSKVEFPSCETEEGKRALAKIEDSFSRFKDEINAIISEF